MNQKAKAAKENRNVLSEISKTALTKVVFSPFNMGRTCAVVGWRKPFSSAWKLRRRCWSWPVSHRDV